MEKGSGKAVCGEGQGETGGREMGEDRKEYILAFIQIYNVRTGAAVLRENGEGERSDSSLKMRE